ncbi:His-Me finger endonucleases family [Trichomonas vaginalis G3]|uniref:His-Me finger endonucleases family n=1 Tax=Trichomonas vaginalis (strain ATCC PRA-98 / G3) TaxID=412133 RepID=UPI0021E57624|nr:His-Me finger endonucleases family [Trichomonas vaginalis G3]KAI5492143.1 His-Me finger endonucleases family [Trichomonas vaginalis G3]
MYAEFVGEDRWETCLLDEKYEIHCCESFEVRNKKTKRVLSGWERNDGYALMDMSGKNYFKHIVIATHFIPNPNNLPFVDHINHIRNDNRLENLRWVTCSENNKNKGKFGDIVFEFVDELEDEAIEITDYGEHTFEFYYYSEEQDSFYLYTGVNYRKLQVCFTKAGYAYVNARDTDGKYVRLYLNKFKKLYGIPF